jgi:hypothetical protein
VTPALAPQLSPPGLNMNGVVTGVLALATRSWSTLGRIWLCRSTRTRTQLVGAGLERLLRGDFVPAATYVVVDVVEPAALHEQCVAASCGALAEEDTWIHPSGGMR